MNSPFKFLNAYEKEDRDIFFGREKEIELLYDTTFKTNLILVYGQSGTGKTSLIQCGLANRFRKSDWFAVFIRRQGNINTSLQREIQKKADTPIEEGATVVESIQSLYLDFLRPVYLIFDQFEELITLGSKSEQQAFFETVAGVLKSGVSCKILIIMREEYIAYLYDFEQVVPGLFDHRIRIESMHSARVDEVIRGSCAKFAIEIETPDETIAEIIENNKNTKGEIQLPFLQVYLDRLYRYTSWKSGKKEPVKFTLDLVKKIGKMSNVMTDFLNEQAAQIQQNLSEKYPRVPDEAVWQILKAFVTSDGTRLQIQSEELNPMPRLSNKSITYCLKSLEGARIIHQMEKDRVYEIAHDTLAKIIGYKRGVEEKTISDLENMIKSKFTAKKGEIPLSKKELIFIQPYEDKLKLNSKEAKYLKQSKEKVSIQKSYIAFGVAAVVLIILTALFAVFQLWRANKNNNTAKANHFAIMAGIAAETNPTIALRIAEKAYRLEKNETVTETIHRIYQENIFHKIIPGYNKKRPDNTKYGDSITTIAFSSDGEYILTGLENNTASLLNSKKMSEQILKGHSAIILTAVFSPDGKSILTGSRDKTARLWDLQGNSIAIFEGHKEEVKIVTFSPDGTYILTGSGDGTARLWNLQGEKMQAFIGHKQGVLSAAFSPDGKYILTGSEDNSALFWGLDGIPVKHLEGHSGGLKAVVFSPCGKYILTGSADNSARLWDIGGAERLILRGHNNQVNTATFSTDGKYILTGSADNTACLWNLQGKKIHTLKGHEDEVWAVDFSPDGKYAFTGSADMTVRQWDLEKKGAQYFRGHEDWIYAAAFSPVAKQVLTGSKDGTARLWDWSGNEKKVFRGHIDRVTSVAFSPDGKYILTGSFDKTARLWNLSGDTVKIFPNHKKAIWSVTFSPDGTYALTGSGDCTARLWEIFGKKKLVLEGHNDKVFAVAYSPDGKYILTGSRDKTARLWDTKGKCLRTFSGHLWPVMAVTFSTDSKYILTSSRDNTAKLWELKGKLLKDIKGHKDWVYSTAFSPDNKYILTGSKDFTTRLWSREGRIVQIFRGHYGTVRSVAFSPDSKFILTGSEDKTARLWEIGATMGLDYFLKKGLCEKLSEDQEKEYGLYNQ